MSAVAVVWLLLLSIHRREQTAVVRAACRVSVPASMRADRSMVSVNYLVCDGMKYMWVLLNGHHYSRFCTSRFHSYMPEQNREQNIAEL
jgi:hypothetical protein